MRDKEITSLKTIALYINDDIQMNFPNPSIEDEVDLIAHAQGSYIIKEGVELVRWRRELNYSGNYKINFIDEFSFNLHGLFNNVPGILKNLRNNRKGYICEIITTDNRSLVFPTPVFLNTENTKEINSHSWNVALSYRVPTHQDYLTKLNTIIMAYSYILGGNNTILGGGAQTAIVGN